MKQGTCEDCGWWDEQKNEKNMLFSDNFVYDTWGYCRRGLPGVPERSGWRWPITRPGDWCGFWTCEEIVDAYFREASKCGRASGGSKEEDDTQSSVVESVVQDERKEAEGYRSFVRDPWEDYR